jgi:hypothetical protein
MRVVELCFAFVLVTGVVFAQGSRVIPAEANPVATRSPKTNSEDLQSLRKQQLTIFQDHVLKRTLDSLRNMDEVTLRMSARIQVLTYLSAGSASSEENKASATKLALDALADFGSHGDEVPAFMAKYLLSDLGAWIQKYRPELLEKFQAVEATKKTGKESDSIRSLLELADGDVLAAQRIRQLFEAGQEVDGLVFYLDELMRRNSKEFEPLLAELVAIAERGSYPSVETLFWVNQIYLEPQVPKAIKQRFLSMVIARTQPANFVFESPPRIAYDLLTQTLPAIRELNPELYDGALIQSFALRSSFTERQLASEVRAKRLRESLNPIEDLVAEAESAKSKTEKNELLAEAAQWALREKKLSLCMDIVAKLDLEVATTSHDFWRNWNDQFLKDLVKAALAIKDSKLAEKGAEHIVCPLARVEGLVLIMGFSARVNDKTRAQDLLAQAIKIAANAAGDVEKAKAFFLLSRASDFADDSQKTSLLESGIKALNNLSKPQTEGNDKKPYEEYVRSLDNVGNELRKSFKRSTKADENGTISLAERLQKPDLRVFAMIGILEGLDDLLTSRKN